MSKLTDLRNIGQSIWLDFISRELIRNGELKALIKTGVRGVTSNPVIFEKAISDSSEYDEQIRDALLMPCSSIEETLAELMDQYGPKARICVLPEGPQTIPFIENGE